MWCKICTETHQAGCGTFRCVGCRLINNNYEIRRVDYPQHTVKEHVAAAAWATVGSLIAINLFVAWLNTPNFIFKLNNLVFDLFVFIEIFMNYAPLVILLSFMFLVASPIIIYIMIGIRRLVA